MYEAAPLGGLFFFGSSSFALDALLCKVLPSFGHLNQLHFLCLIVRLLGNPQTLRRVLPISLA
jgi:hypothetical protein